MYVFSSMSTKTGVAPQKVMASAVAIKVLGTVITSSPGPIAKRQKRQPECFGTTADANGIFALAEFGEIFFEFLDKTASGKGGGVDDLLDGFVYFVFDGVVLGFEIEKGDFHFISYLFTAESRRPQSDIFSFAADPS